jgi:hypothetical protein
MSSAFFEHRKAKKNGGAIDGFDHRRLLAYLIAAPSTPTPVVEQGIARNGEPMTRAKAIEVLASAGQDFREAAGHLMRARINPRRQAHCRSNSRVTGLRVSAHLIMGLGNLCHGFDRPESYFLPEVFS